MTDEAHTSAIPLLLTVAVPTIPSRNAQLASIYDKLTAQSTDRPVEIIALLDNKRRSIGAKRNALLSMSQAAFLTFVDDDDDVADNYVEALLGAICQTPDTDCIVFDAWVTHDGQHGRLCHYGTEFDDVNTASEYYRRPNHICCYRTDLARQFSFPDTSYGEDCAWASHASRLVKKQSRVEQVLYYYRFSRTGSESMRSALAEQSRAVGQQDDKSGRRQHDSAVSGDRTDAEKSPRAVSPTDNDSHRKLRRAPVSSSIQFDVPPPTGTEAAELLSVLPEGLPLAKPPSVVVEYGVGVGVSLVALAKSFPGVRVVGIAESATDSFAPRSWLMGRLRKHRNAELVLDSPRVLPSFEPHSIDVLHFDLRTLRQPLSDSVREWSPKLADGGCMVFSGTETSSDFQNVIRSLPGLTDQIDVGEGLCVWQATSRDKIGKSVPSHPGKRSASAAVLRASKTPTNKRSRK